MQTSADAASGRLVVALDGPAGSGKSTVARAVATHLGWRYVDTGATYRAATLAALRAQVDLEDAGSLAGLVEALAARGGLVLGTDPAAPSVVLDGEDVSVEVRTAEVTAAVSAVSAVPAVRTCLVALQRAAIGTQGAVAEGRDVAKVVAPGAAVKVYLDADPAVRASRRAADADAGVRPEDSDLVAAVAADLARRDRFDSTRTASPLSVADGAVHVDASSRSAAEVVAVVLGLVEGAGLRVR